jgi:hypothetical protein
MDSPRLMPRSAKLLGNGVEVFWEPTEAHHGEVVARYELRPPDAIDLNVTVRTRGNYAGYELFLSSYFDQALKPHVFLKPNPFTKPAGEPQLVVPMVSELYRGTLPVFARDAYAAQHCIDGRWERSERQSPIVQMCPVRHYAYPIAFLTVPDSRVAVVLLSHPKDCYAISTRYFVDNEVDRLTNYSAFDHSLFGHDAASGDERTARMRLLVTQLDDAKSQPLALYRDFLKEIEEGNGTQ